MSLKHTVIKHYYNNHTYHSYGLSMRFLDNVKLVFDTYDYFKTILFVYVLTTLV
jgi:hypothetical protein